MDRFHRRDLRPTRAYVQRHFSDSHTSTLHEQCSNSGKEKLYTIRESINEGNKLLPLEVKTLFENL